MRVAFLVSSLVLALVLPAHALPPQAASSCPANWIATFGGMPGVNGHVFALTEFDDGNGPALYAGGAFTSAGGIEANRIARWVHTRCHGLVAGLVPRPVDLEDHVALRRFRIRADAVTTRSASHVQS